MNNFLSENGDLSKALLDLIKYYRSIGKELLKDLKSVLTDKNEYIFYGMGTSEFTPLSIQWALARLGVSSRIFDAGEWYYYGTTAQKSGSMSFFTSQSGESIEVKNFVGRGEIRKRYIAITNDERSTLAVNSLLSLPLCAGSEQSITTKTYTNNIALLYLISAVLSDDTHLEKTLDNLEATSEIMMKIDIDSVEKARAVFSREKPIMFVGRGFSYISARQSALTFMEGARCITSAFTGGAFNHGPLEAVDHDSCLVVFHPKGKTYRLINNLLVRTAKLGTRVVRITDAEEKNKPNCVTIETLSLNGDNTEYLFPLFAAPIHNLLLYKVAVDYGIEVGRFRYGGKITREE